MAKKKSFWISYDLGLKGDYNNLYKVLDNLKAKECGDSVAYFTYNCESMDYASEVSRFIKSNLDLNKTDRLYLIWRSDKGSILGKFINGNRKRAPWEGYGTQNEVDELDDADE